MQPQILSILKGPVLYILHYKVFEYISEISKPVQRDVSVLLVNLYNSITDEILIEINTCDYM